MPTESESNSSGEDGEEEEGPASSEMSSTKATSSQEGKLPWEFGNEIQLTDHQWMTSA